jgi:hypothetical protein
MIFVSQDNIVQLCILVYLSSNPKSPSKRESIEFRRMMIVRDDM